MVRCGIHLLTWDHALVYLLEAERCDGENVASGARIPGFKSQPICSSPCVFGRFPSLAVSEKGGLRMASTSEVLMIHYL